MSTHYFASVYRRTSDSRIVWYVSRSRVTQPGSPVLSSIVAEGTLADLSVPAGTPLEQADAIFAALSEAVSAFLEAALRELDSQP